MSTDLLERAALFAGLTQEERSLVAQHLHLHHFAAGEMAFSEGSASTALYLIKNGGVRLNVGPIMLATLGAGAVFGEADVFMGRRRSLSAQATTNTDVWALSQHDLAQIIAANPSIGLTLSRNFGAGLVQIEHYLVDERLRRATGMEALSRDDLSLIAKRLTLETFRSGRPLYREGDPSNSLYILESGTVLLQRGQDMVEVGSGEVLGTMALVANKTHLETALAQDEVQAWALSRGDFEELMVAAPHVRSRLCLDLRAQLSAEDEALAVERLRALPIFSTLDQTTLRAVTRRLLLRHVPEGEIVYREGDPGDALYLIDAGRVEIVSSVSRRGEVLAGLGSGGFFGEMALLTGRSRNTGARAAQDTNLWTLYRADFDHLTAAHPALGQALAETLSDRLAQGGEGFGERHLRQIALFSGLTAEQLADVAEQLIPARYRKDEVIYRRGDDGNRLFMIEDGLVQLSNGQTGMEISDGAYFGVTSLLTGETHAMTAVARTDSDLWALSRDAFEALVLKYPVLGLNLSRELSRRLQGQLAAGAAVTDAHRVRTPAAAVPAAAIAARGAAPPRRTSVPVVRRKQGPVESLVVWYSNLTTGARLRLVLVLLLVAWLIGIALPATVVNALQSSQAVIDGQPHVPSVAVASASNSVAPVALALANRQSEPEALAPTATYTPAPTETPVPTDTPTPTPTPTDTPIPTATPTDTPVPTATPTDTPVPPTPTPRPVAQVQVAAVPAAAAAAAQPTTPPQPAVQYSLVEMRRLDACENRGKHNIYVEVVDANGNGVNGVWAIQTPNGNPGEVIDRKQTADKDNWILAPKAGRLDFVMFKGAEYMVFISNDGATPASTDFAAGLHSGFTDEINCADGGGGNTLFHNSFSVIFRKNY